MSAACGKRTLAVRTNGFSSPLLYLGVASTLGGAQGRVSPRPRGEVHRDVAGPAQASRRAGPRSRGGEPPAPPPTPPPRFPPPSPHPRAPRLARVLAAVPTRAARASPEFFAGVTCLFCACLTAGDWPYHAHPFLSSCLDLTSQPLARLTGWFWRLRPTVRRRRGGFYSRP